MIALLDLGNSRLKWAFATGQPGPADSLTWADANWHRALRDRLSLHEVPQQVLGASVTTPERRRQVDEVLASMSWPTASWLRSPAKFGCLINAYDVPQDLGIDRFLIMLAALDAGLAPCVVASSGTALTLDALAADGQHLGGQIVPGIEAMQSGLHSAAPVLPAPQKAQCLNFARSTVDAMYSGVWQTSAAAIERFAAKSAERMRCRPRVLLCGGNAESVAALLGIESEPFAQAVLRGLHVWSRAGIE